jgi:lipid A 3-O-deacylase
MGCPVTLRESGGLGLQITSNIDVIASIEHVSHANLCGRQNPGLTNFGLRLG